MEKKSAVKRTQGEAQAKNGTSAGRDTGSRPLANRSYPPAVYTLPHPTCKSLLYSHFIPVPCTYSSSLYVMGTRMNVCAVGWSRVTTNVSHIEWYSMYIPLSRQTGDSEDHYLHFHGNILGWSISVGDGFPSLAADPMYWSAARISGVYPQPRPSIRS